MLLYSAAYNPRISASVLRLHPKYLTVEAKVSLEILVIAESLEVRSTYAGRLLVSYAALRNSRS